jgi:SAM-dependent methyltransferase
MPVYNTIGHGYAKTRLADSRITSRLIELLNLPANAQILDVGAGTGKYARALAEQGYQITALEPSEVMRAQSVPHQAVQFLPGFAENIPLPDHSRDGAIVVLATHHFEDRNAAFREIFRVVGEGPLVLFTFDLKALRTFWLADYFPKLGCSFRTSFSAQTDVAAELKLVTSRKVSVIPFPLPRDLEDKFGAASWARPEDYLDPVIRNGISDFSLMNEVDLTQGLAKLKADLQSGDWDSQYGFLRTQASYDIGYQFIVVEK